MQYFAETFASRYLYLPILVLTGCVKLLSASERIAVLDTLDPIVGIPIRFVLIATAIFELGVAGVIVSAAAPAFKHGLVLWLGGQFLIYRAFKGLFGASEPCPCLGNMAGWLGLSTRDADSWSFSLAVFLALTSGFCLSVVLARNRERAQVGPACKPSPLLSRP